MCCGSVCHVTAAGFSLNAVLKEYLASLFHLWWWFLSHFLKKGYLHFFSIHILKERGTDKYYSIRFISTCCFSAFRRMFPAMRVKIAGLDPHQQYYIAMDIVPVDNKRYRYPPHTQMHEWEWKPVPTYETVARRPVQRCLSDCSPDIGCNCPFKMYLHVSCHFCSASKYTCNPAFLHQAAAKP